LAQNELQKRINSDLGQKLNQLTEITDKNAGTSLQGTRSANKLSKLAIVISVIGILVQVYLTLSSK